MMGSSMELPTASTLFFRVIAVSALGTGALGVLLPLVPTTPFLLIALWATARGAPEWHDRLLAHPRYGATLRAWQHHGAIPARARIVAVLVMTASWLALWVAGTATWLLLALALMFAALTVFLATRPGVPPQ